MRSLHARYVGVSNLRRWVVRQAAMTSRRNPLDFAYESLVETSRQENLSSPLFSGVLGAAHVRPEAVRKHPEGTRTFDQGAVEAVG